MTKIEDVFKKQACFQSILNSDNQLNDYPRDDVELYSKSVLLMVEEIGELLKEDKRWRDFRSDKFDKQAKADEIADVFITLMNVCLYSNISAEQLMNSVSNKMESNLIYAIGGKERE